AFSRPSEVHHVAVCFKAYKSRLAL
nr:hypothetical protein [Tanacetum cinerariifolium]